MIKKAIEELRFLRDWIWDNRDKGQILTSYPPQHIFKRYTSIESVLNKLNAIEKELYYPDSNKYKRAKDILAPIRAYISSYKDNNGPITNSFYNGLLDYLQEIEIYIINLQADPELIDFSQYKYKYIPIEEAENWLQHRLMTDISELNQYIGNH